MTGNKEIRIEAKTVEAAVVMACVKLGVTQDNIEYEVLKQPKSGFMSIFGGKAEIKAWPRGRQGAHKGPNNRGGDRHSVREARSENQQARGPQDGSPRRDRDGGNREQNRDGNRGGRNQGNKGRQPQNREDRPERKPREFTPREERAPAEPLTAETLAQLEVEIRNFCKELCEKIVGETVTVSSEMTPERLQLEVDNASIAQLISEQGKFVESLEHILRKKPRHLKQDLPFRIFIDAQGSRKGREDEIARIAREKADHVADSGSKVVLDYKSAADRKIVHMTLENDQRVYTKSIGTGSGRKLMILPSRGRKPAAEATETEDDNAQA